MSNFKNIWIVGDIHGNWLPVRSFYGQHKKELSKDYKENLLILLGDVGANFYLDNTDKKFKKKLSTLPFTYFCIRGNHEERPSVLAKNNPTEWNKIEQFENFVWVENAYPKILYALDEGGEYNINNHSVLIAPGAYSIDKLYRIFYNYPWFPGEQLDKNEQNNILNSLKPHYDFIFSHTCPISWHTYISDLFLKSVDQSKVDMSMEKFLEQIAQNTSWNHWYFGHYHKDRDLPTNATMLFQTAIPLGKNYSEYFNSQLTF